MEKYVTTLVNLVPDANISYSGIDIAYDEIEWLDERIQPSKEECDAAWPKIKYDIEYTNVQNSRIKQYRDISDPLFFGWQRGENTEQEWLDAVQAVKDANPYPEAPVA